MPNSDGLPPLGTEGTCIIQVLGTPEGQESLWNTAKWDEAVWATTEWRDITGQSVNAQATWGTDENAGALSVPAAGSWSIVTYDPQRLLDPANTASPMRPFLFPGGFVRILYREPVKDTVVRVGFIDEVDYDVSTLTGSIRATDGISVLVKAKVPAGVAHLTDVPFSLRARARWILNRAGVSYIKVEPDPPDEADPAVGMAINSLASAWEQITTAAYDAMFAVWLDREGLLRFRHFGSPAATGIILGGKDPLSIAIDAINTKLSLESVYNHVRAHKDDLDSDQWDEVSNAASVNTYGDLVLERERPNPDSWEWVNQVLRDRGAAATQYEIATIRPQTPAQLLSLLDLGMMSRVQIRAENVSPAVVQDVYVLGGRFEANVDTGWTAGVVVYKPHSTLFGPSKIKVERRGVVKSVEIWNNFGGTNGQNSSAAMHEVKVSPMAVTGDSVHHALLAFNPIDWTGIKKLVQARLRIYRPYHQDTEQEPPKDAGGLSVYNLAGIWDEATPWPGPVTTGTAAFGAFTQEKLGDWMEIDVTANVRRWAPASVEGGGAMADYGLKIQPFWATGPTEHMIFGGRRSSLGAYLYFRMERE